MVLSTATDLYRGVPGLELGAVGGGACSVVGAPFRGGAPPQRITIGRVHKEQTTSDFLSRHPVALATKPLLTQ
jgi:hypothetical protein